MECQDSNCGSNHSVNRATAITLGNQFGQTNFFLKMGHPRPLFRLFSVFFKQTLQFLQYVKNVHPVYGAGIRTHDLQNMSLLP